MKHVSLALLIGLTISACATLDKGTVNDASLEQLLQHTWAGREASADVVIEGETTYLPEGRVNMIGHLRQKGRIRTLNGSGTWHVKGGYLYWTVTKSNFADVIPNGFASADKIVRVTENEFTYVSSEDGKIKTEHRIR